MMAPSPDDGPQPHCGGPRAHLCVLSGAGPSLGKRPWKQALAGASLSWR